MSVMLADTTLDRVRRYLRENIHRRNLHGAPSRSTEEEMIDEARQAEPDETTVRLEVVEHPYFTAVAVPTPEKPNALCHFLDGIQRQRILYYDGTVPVFYAYLAAVVRSRVDGRMCCLMEESTLRQDALYAPLNWVDKAGLKAYGIPVHDTIAHGTLEIFPSHPILLQMAVDTIKSHREKLERDLAQRWLAWMQSKHSEDWLVVDGSIRDINVSESSMRLVGLAKTSMAIERALTPDQAQVIYGLNRGERSSVFLIERQKHSPVYSWFLRLHDSLRQSPRFGLLRVEVPAMREMLEEADNVSGWLLEDRVPLTVPDPRYDRLLYPMRDCEQYLRSLAPSRAKLEALAQIVL